MRPIDADALEKDGWMMNRIVQVDKNTMSYQTKKPTDFPTIEPEPKWIPVDLQNNSPEENKVVLLGVRFRDDFKYFVTSRQDYNYWIGLGRAIKGELKWQPLPEPYREEGDE